MFCVPSKPKLTPLLRIAKSKHFPRILGHGSIRRHKSTAVPKPSKLHAKSSENTLALEIDRRFGKRKRKAAGQPSADRTRLNIVSGDLCDDIIARLAGSLERHSNCDIIDVNPGAGLWSSKLHAAIKPRSHILFEPEYEIYKPFLQPLLDEKGSKYKLIPKSGILWDNLNLVKSENYLPNQELLTKGDSRLKKSNDSLLFVANFGYYPSKSYEDFTSVSTLTIHQLLSAARAHSLFNEYGLVRMLIWLRDEEKTYILPRVISHRKKFSVEAEISCERIHEIAGSDESQLLTKREHELDVVSARNVMNRMKEEKIETPINRMSKLQTEALHTPESFKLSYSPERRPSFKVVEELEQRYARREFCSYYDKNGNPVYLDLDKTTRVAVEGKRTPEWQRLLTLRNRRLDVSRVAERAHRLALDYESIIFKQRDLEKCNSVDVHEKVQALRQELSAWRAEVDRVSEPLRNGLFRNIDNRRVFRQDPPILFWDRREAEPLMVSADEFFPQHEMCLLDFHPRSVWPVIQGANYDYFDFIMGTVLFHSTQSTIHALKTLAPGAEEWIISRCPSLKDTSRGGVEDLDLLSVRTLNQQMLQEIMEAWMEWPFRPTKREMISRMGAKVNWSGDEEDFGLKDMEYEAQQNA